LPRVRARFVALPLLAALATATACADGGGGTERAAARPTTSTRLVTTSTVEVTTTVPPTTTAPPPTTLVAEQRPVAAADPAGLAAQLVLAESVIADPATSPSQLAAAAHLQQVVYRQLGRHPEWDAEVLSRVPAELHEAVGLHAGARREFMARHSRMPDTMPAWRIVDPEPPETLLAYYQEAEATFGVAWQYLAAINLVETGMGRIRGTSVAGAQGPMQFMPATWAAYGEGDVDSARDSIMAAGRYLAANGFAEGNVDNAIWHYNHSWHYVAGVRSYARLIELQPRAYDALHRWQIYYSTVAGDVLLPTGFELHERMPVDAWLAANPQA
jgi:membrane-bound lytic murein transglycosylase B